MIRSFKMIFCENSLSSVYTFQIMYSENVTINNFENAFSQNVISHLIIARVRQSLFNKKNTLFIKCENHL